MNSYLNPREILKTAVNNPKHKGLTSQQKESSISGKVNNCLDEIFIYINIENDRLKEIKYDGQGCSISMASAELLSKELLNKTFKEAKEVLYNFEALLDNKNWKKDKVGSLDFFVILQQQQGRVKCAKLSLNIIKEILC